jgi:hypothetical protein
VDTARGRTYRGEMSSPGDQGRPDEPAPELPPYVYNPYGNVSYPATYPVPPAGFAPEDDRPPVRRPGTLHVALVLQVLAALPYLLFGFLATTGAETAVAALPPEQLTPLREAGFDPVQLVRSMGALVLGVAGVFVLLALLAWTGRPWARGLLAAMTIGFVLLVLAFVAAGPAQGLAVDGASLLVLAAPVTLAAVGVAMLFGAAARAWFTRPRR